MKNKTFVASYESQDLSENEILRLIVRKHLRHAKTWLKISKLYNNSYNEFANASELYNCAMEAYNELADNIIFACNVEASRSVLGGIS